MTNPKESIRAKAREALEKSGGDWAKAAKLFHRWVNSDEELYREIAEPLIAGAIWAVIREAARAARKEAWDSAARMVWPAANPDPGATASALASIAQSRLMAFPLPSGLPLGEATRPQLVEAQEMYEKFAQGNAVKGRWLALVAARLPNDRRRVSKALKEEDLLEMQAQAKAAA